MLVLPGFNSIAAPIGPPPINTSLAISASHEPYHPRLPRQVNSRQPFPPLRRAHLATTTRRYANSLAPRCGERARERGSFPPMVVMPRCAPLRMAGSSASGSEGGLAGGIPSCAGRAFQIKPELALAAPPASDPSAFETGACVHSPPAARLRWSADSAAPSAPVYCGRGATWIGHPKTSSSARAMPASNATPPVK